MKLSFRLVIATVFLTCFSLAANAGQPIKELENIPVGIKVDGGKFTEKEVSEAIIRACRGRGWTPRLEAPNKMAASITVRKHRAEVEIPFTADAFSIRYRSSENLDANPQRRTIHRNYNRWVANLSQDIARELGSLSAERP